MLEGCADFLKNFERFYFYYYPLNMTLHTKTRSSHGVKGTSLKIEREKHRHNACFTINIDHNIIIMKVDHYQGRYAVTRYGLSSHNRVLCKFFAYNNLHSPALQATSIRVEGSIRTESCRVMFVKLTACCQLPIGKIVNREMATNFTL